MGRTKDDLGKRVAQPIYVRVYCVVDLFLFFISFLDVYVRVAVLAHLFLVKFLCELRPPPQPTIVQSTTESGQPQSSLPPF